MEQKVMLKELPEECWELILNQLCHLEDLRSPSLVCKQFLSIINRNRRILDTRNPVFYDNRCEGLFRSLRRFPNLKEMVIYDTRNVDINFLVGKIDSSGLDLQVLELSGVTKPPRTKSFEILGSTMKNLKSLRCIDVLRFGDGNLAGIANAFPGLEELDIHCSSGRHSVTDSGIKIMSRKLGGLHKIDITGLRDCSDRSLIALSRNCLLLQEIKCSGTTVTEYGICVVLRQCGNLISLQAAHKSPASKTSLTFENSMIYAVSLRVLDLSPHRNQDQLLGCIARARIPLEKIVIHSNHDFSIDGLLTFLFSCPSLKHLHLSKINFLNDQTMSDLLPFLPNLVGIKLISCSNLTTATLLSLAKQCPMLSEIELTFIELEVGDNFLDMDLGRNYRIRYIDVGFNAYLNDPLLKRIGAVCPNLQTLNVKGCRRLTNEGIGEILKCCSKIEYLVVDRSREMEIVLEQLKPRHIKVENYSQEEKNSKGKKKKHGYSSSLSSEDSEDDRSSLSENFESEDSEDENMMI